MKQENVLLIGARGIGKSTLFREILQEYRGQWTGLFSLRLLHGQKPVGYALQLNRQPEAHLFAWEAPERPAFGRYQVDVEPFKIAAAFIRKAVREQPELFVIDELGVIEQSCQEYVEAVRDLLSSSVRTCLVVQQRALPFWEVFYTRRPLILTLQANDRQAAAERLRAILVDRG